MSDEDEFDEILTGDDTSLDDDLRDGAAMISAEVEPDLDPLPRLLRYAVRSAAAERGTARRLGAEIIDVAPEAEPALRNWLSRPTEPRTVALAACLDRLSVEKDMPALRALADSVRIVALPVPVPGGSNFADYMRVMRAMTIARDACDDVPDEIRARINRAVLGWAAAPLLAAQRLPMTRPPAIQFGAERVDDLTAAKAQAAVALAQSRVGSHEMRSDLSTGEGAEPPCPADHVIVCRRALDVSPSARANDVARTHAHVINLPVALVPCPDLAPVRRALLAEYPYAAHAVEFCLAGLVGRRFVQFEPLLLVGAPGSGKTRFVRRLCELLDVGLWRVDATQADGSAIAGTDKRWSTASPCAPLLAISRHKHANPVMLIDEVDKAATRADYGRLWDSLVALCERENTFAYPDPGLGAPLDISWVSFIATGNSLSGLPAPLIDRFRVVAFDSPRAQDLDLLAEIFRLDLARQRRIDARFIDPLTANEHDIIATQWGGGSARVLRRMLDVIWRSREESVAKH